MLHHPSPTPQALFYVDEIAPYLPPVRKPVCKDALGLLFRQGRKYRRLLPGGHAEPRRHRLQGAGPDLDVVLGRLVVRQDVKKVKNQLKALTPEGAEEIARRLPA